MQNKQHIHERCMAVLFDFKVEGRAISLYKCTHVSTMVMFGVSILAYLCLEPPCCIVILFLLLCWIAHARVAQGTSGSVYWVTPGIQHIKLP